MNLATVKTHLNTMFNKIGSDKDKHTASPPSTNNRSSIAWEYFIADFAQSYWKKRRDNAKKDADAAGILVPTKPGEQAKCYQNETLEIVAKTNRPSRKLNEQTLVLALIKSHGLTLTQAKQLLESCREDNAAATTYSVVAAEAVE